MDGQLWEQFPLFLPAGHMCLAKLFTQFVVPSGFINLVRSHVKLEAD